MLSEETFWPERNSISFTLLGKPHKKIKKIKYRQCPEGRRGDTVNQFLWLDDPFFYFDFWLKQNPNCIPLSCFWGHFGFKKKEKKEKKKMECFLGGVLVIFLVPEGHLNHFHLGGLRSTLTQIFWSTFLRGDSMSKVREKRSTSKSGFFFMKCER